MSGKKVVVNLIRNAVYQNTTPEGPPSQELVKTFVKYLANPETVDIVYDNIIERVVMDKTRNQMTLKRAVQLLKTHLMMYLPGYETLRKLDSFCQSLITDSEPILKSIAFVRTLIANQLKKTPAAAKNEAVSGPTSPRLIDVAMTALEKRKSREFKSATPPKEIFFESKVPTLLGPAGYIANNLPVKGRDPPKSIRRVSSFTGSMGSMLFGGQFKRHSVNLTKDPDMLRIADDTANWNHMKNTSNLKKSSAEESKRKTTTYMRVKGPMLFHYKHYSTQQPLNLTDKELDLIVSTVVRPLPAAIATPSKVFIQCRLMAMKIIIKCFIDIFISEGAAGAPVMQSVLREMQASEEPQTRVLAFDLILNLAVHANLIEEVRLESNVDEPNSSPRSWSGTGVSSPGLGTPFAPEPPAHFKIARSRTEFFDKVKPDVTQDRPRGKTDAEFGRTKTEFFERPRTEGFSIKPRINAFEEKAKENSPKLENLQKQATDKKADSPSLLKTDMKIDLGSVINQSSPTSAPKSPSPKAKPDNKLVLEFQECIFELLVGMLTFLIHQREGNPEVWKTAVSCMLFFVTDGGCAVEQRVARIDPRVIPTFLASTASFSGFTRDRLLQLQVPAFYVNSKQLDLRALQLVGGVTWIIDMYTLTRNLDVRNSLFMIIVDYALIKMAQRRSGFERHGPQATMLVEVLQRFDAAQHFYNMFKFLPEKFMDDFVRNVMFEQIRKEPSLAHIVNKIDKHFVLKILQELEKFAIDFQKLAPEFDQQMQQMLVATVVNEVHFATLEELLNSDVPSHVKQGEIWLFSLMRSSFEARGPLAAPVQELVDAIFIRLLSSPVSRVRRTYISLVDKFVLLIKSNKFQTHGDEPGIEYTSKVLNGLLGRIASSNERDEGNLLYTLDILLDLISMRISTAQVSLVDSTYVALLKGHSVISRVLLKHLDVLLFKYVFENLLSPEASAARIVALHVMIDKCKSKDRVALETVGGTAFFQSLLVDKDPQVSFHASHFLIALFDTERPEEYRNILSQLLDEARKTNNESLVSNPYFQVQAIMKFNSKS